MTKFTKKISSILTTFCDKTYRNMIKDQKLLRKLSHEIFLCTDQETKKSKESKYRITIRVDVNKSVGRCSHVIRQFHGRTFGIQTRSSKIGRNVWPPFNEF